jgi:hypothetical protein
MYEVDTGNFDVYDAHTFYSDVNDFRNLTANGPTFRYEYSARDTYGPAAGWPESAPLNATFWHAVTEAMEKDHSLVSRFNTLQGKSSVLTPNCTSAACAAAKICYMRSGDVALGRQCPQVSDCLVTQTKNASLLQNSRRTDCSLGLWQCPEPIQTKLLSDMLVLGACRRCSLVYELMQRVVMMYSTSSYRYI